MKNTEGWEEKYPGWTLATWKIVDRFKTKASKALKSLGQSWTLFIEDGNIIDSSQDSFILQRPSMKTRFAHNGLLMKVFKNGKELDYVYKECRDFRFLKFKRNEKTNNLEKEGDMQFSPGYEMATWKDLMKARFYKSGIRSLYPQLLNVGTMVEDDVLRIGIQYGLIDPTKEGIA